MKVKIRLKVMTFMVQVTPYSLIIIANIYYFSNSSTHLFYN
jgi:hypothetical protein